MPQIDKKRAPSPPTSLHSKDGVKSAAEIFLEDASTTKRRLYMSRVGNRRLPPHMDREDILQISLEKLWRNRDTLKATSDGGNPGGALNQTVNRSAIDAARSLIPDDKVGLESLERGIVIGGDIDALPITQQAPMTTDTFVEQKEARQQFAAAFNTALDQVHATSLDRSLLYGASVEGKSCEELAVECADKYTPQKSTPEKELTSTIVRSRLFQIRRKLKKNAMIQQLREDFL